MTRLKNLGRLLLFLLAIPFVFLVVLPGEYIVRLMEQIPVAFRRANRRTKVKDVPEDFVGALQSLRRVLRCIWTGDEYELPSN